MGGVFAEWNSRLWMNGRPNNNASHFRLPVAMWSQNGTCPIPHVRLDGEVSPGGERALLAGPRTCPACGRLLRPRQQRACSRRCRAAMSRNRREAERRARLEEVVAHLESALCRPPRTVALCQRGAGARSVSPVIVASCQDSRWRKQECIRCSRGGERAPGRGRHRRRWLRRPARRRRQARRHPP
jgi:predicted nucleic acid-binding Zn ribbon protein